MKEPVEKIENTDGVETIARHLLTLENDMDGCRWLAKAGTGIEGIINIIKPFSAIKKSSVI